MKSLFICGCSRSGTTLLAAMLGNHPDAICPPEAPFISGCLKGFQGDWSFPRDNEIILSRIFKNWRFRFWGLSPADLPDTNSFQDYRDIIHSLVKLYGTKTGKPDGSIWIDHFPGNCKHLHALFTHFPEAKAIHLVRDGRATAASVIPLDWGPNTVFFAARWWAEKVSYGLAAESFFGKERVLRVRFEDLVDDPDKTLKHICSFLEIDFHQEMIFPGGLEVPQYTHKQHALIGQTLDPSRIDLWEKKLTPDQVEIFESETGDLLRYLGYSPKFGLGARKNSLRTKVLSLLKEIFTILFKNFWLFRLRRHLS